MGTGSSTECGAHTENMVQCGTFLHQCHDGWCCRLWESVKPGGFSNSTSLSCCSAIIWQFLYLVLSNLSISRCRSWVLTRLLMRWGNSCSFTGALGRISLQRSKTCNIWKKRSVNNKPRTGASLSLPFLLGRRLVSSTISSSDTDLRRVPLQMVTPAKWAVTLLSATLGPVEQRSYCSLNTCTRDEPRPFTLLLINSYASYILSGNSYVRAQEYLETRSSEDNNSQSGAWRIKKSIVIHDRRTVQSPDEKQKDRFSSAFTSAS